MKAEAPEKIYVHIKDKPCEITFSEVIEKGCLNIEYTRTDAFIAKVCKWLEKNIAELTGIDSYAITESFKQAMEE